jgi:hypothetical protein
MEFLYISSLGEAYRYAVKIEQKLKQKMTCQFGPGNPSKQKLEKGSPNPQKKGQRKYGQYQDNQSNPQAKETRKKNKDIGKWCDFHKKPWHNIVECCSKQSLVAKVKASKLDVGSDSESERERGRQIIDAEPSATIATTNF